MTIAEPGRCTVLGGGDFLASVYDLCRRNPGVEQAGLWFVKPLELHPNRIFLSREFVGISPDRLVKQTNRVISPDPLCLIWACRQAKATHAILFLVHTHPGAGEPVSFSDADEQAEITTAPKIMALSGKEFFGAVVVGYHSYQARLWWRQAGTLMFDWVNIMAEAEWTPKKG